jgi:4-diphosphocytidyl-2-C-methyl-D-erythritol kinase
MPPFRETSFYEASERLFTVRAADDAIVNTAASAPAKINLTLEILAPRPDGYHALRSVAVPIELSDNLSWQAHAEFHFACSDANLGNDDNLVARAARAIGLEREPLMIFLDKRIPYGSGLGGGSSDAACLLLAAMRGAFGPQPERDWLAIARALGSDVPFFLLEAPGLIEATGERVTALGANPDWWAVLLCPPARVSTREAYAQFDLADKREGAAARNASVSLRMIEALQRREFLTVCDLLSNDFERTVFAHAGMADAIAVFTRFDRRAHLSGSGSTLFALCQHENEALALAESFRADTYVREQNASVYASRFRQSASWRRERVS